MTSMISNILKKTSTHEFKEANKEFIAEETERENKRVASRLAKAEKYGVRFETRAEANKAIKNYIKVNNEGGEGFVPYDQFISQEEIDELNK